MRLEDVAVGGAVMADVAGRRPIFPDVAVGSSEIAHVAIGGAKFADVAVGGPEIAHVAVGIPKFARVAVGVAIQVLVLGLGSRRGCRGQNGRQSQNRPKRVTKHGVAPILPDD